jgi:hypothetical protein
VQDDLDSIHLLIAEHAVIFVVKQQHAETMSLEYLVLRQLQIGT